MPKTLFLASACAALLLAAWLAFAPAGDSSDANELVPTAELQSAEGIELPVAPNTAAQAERLHTAQEDDRIDAEGPASTTCAPLFRPGDLWVRWIDREGRPAPAPRAMLTSLERAEDLVLEEDLVPEAVISRAEEIASGEALGQAEGEAEMHELALEPTEVHESEQLWRIEASTRIAAALREGRARIRVEGLFPRPSSLELAYDAARSTPLVLHLPPHGELVVVLDGGGLGLPPSTRCKFPLGNATSRRAGDFRVLEGRIDEEFRVPLVSLDEELEFGVIAFRGQLRDSHRIKGPVRDGEVRRIELGLGVTRPLLLVRLQDDRGAPLKEEQLHAQWTSGSSTLGATLRTTSDGRMLWTPAFEGEPPFVGDLELTRKTGAAARLRALAIPSNGLVDLGVLQLAIPRASFGGRVLDANGAGVARATVEIELVKIAGAAPAPEVPQLLHSAVREAAREATREADAELPPEALAEANAGIDEVLGRNRPQPRSVTLRTDELGRFAWNDPRAADAQNELRVAANFGFRASTPRIVRGGGTNVELALQDASDLGGHALLPEGAAFPIVLRLRAAADAPHARPEEQRTRLSPRSTFRFFNLLPGNYELEIEMTSADRSASFASLLTLRDLVVPAGGACADPRLEPIDLRELLGTFRFELRGAPSERSSGRDRIWCRRSDLTTGAWLELPCPRGDLYSWVLPRSTYDFVFDLHWARRISLRGLSAGQPLTWRPALRARLFLELAEESAEVHAERHWSEITFTMSGDPPLELEALEDEGAHELWLPRPGEVRIERELWGRDEEEGWTILRIAERTLTIRDQDEVQEFRVRLD
jgi:hypothetical protein